MAPKIDVEFVNREKTCQLMTIFEKMSKGKYPSDDTLLEKLISNLSTKKHSDVLKQLALHEEFINKLDHLKFDSNIENLNPISLTGLLKFVGILSAEYYELLNKENDICNSTEHSNYISSFINQCLKSSSAMTDKSVTNAILFCLKMIYCNQSRLTFYDKGYLTFIRSCLECNSVFIRNSAVDLTSQLIVLCSRQTETKNKKPDHSYILDLYKCFMVYFGSEKSDYVKISLEILLQVFKYKDDISGLSFFVTECNLDENLLTLLISAEDIDVKKCLDILKKMADLSFVKESTKAKLVNIPVSMIEKGKLFAAINICGWLLSRDDCENKDIERLVIDLHNLALESYKVTSSRKNTVLLQQCIGVFPNMLHNRSFAVKLLTLNLTQSSSKLQKTYLNVLTKMTERCQDIPEELIEILTACCSVLSTTNEVMFEVTSCLLVVLLHAKAIQCTSEDLKIKLQDQLETLGKSLPEKLMSIKWEIRDTAVEFIGSLASIAQGFPILLQWLNESNFVVHIIQDMEDGESYVRASAIIALYKWLIQPSCSAIVLNKFLQDDILNKVISIAQTDSQAIPRRAAIECCSGLIWKDMFSLKSNNIIHLMCSSISDFDWEVKMNVLTFWESFISDVLHDKIKVEGNNYVQVNPDLEDNHPRSLDFFREELKMVQTSGCVKVLFTSLLDYDKAVQQKSVVIIKEIKSQCDHHDVFAQLDASDDHHDVFAQLDASDDVTDNNHIPSVEYYEKRFPAILQKIDGLHAFKSAAADADEENMESLLNDIIVALCPVVDCFETEDNEGNGVIVDCY